MKVLVAIAVDDDGGVASAARNVGMLDEIDRAHLAGEAIQNLLEGCGSSTYRLLWAEIEIPPPPPPIQAQAQEDE